MIEISEVAGRYREKIETKERESCHSFELQMVHPQQDSKDKKSTDEGQLWKKTGKGSGQSSLHERKEADFLFEKQMKVKP